ncbi:DUF4238 domain-containing protein [Limosilactobacillus ingluviei]|uniref:DUF4238 domain-containing protein n=1 Tax=Limosilactobacillus ingluviei DSM 15946 TaxID=1423760 RepID=A0A0R1U6J3_9LACO|nr:DUF4238 domain-containing protein [Limosilactobacillus ingluviei]KRL88845.1 hypothetical protein FC43_GL000052 [Limosilactobacillus ingluviei DSM 15946]
MGSKPKNQHYVPRVYFKPWRNENKKIWIANKNCKNKIDERKEEKILSSRNLYTINFDQKLVIKNCEEIKKEFVRQISNLMDSRNVYAKYHDRKIKTLNQIESDLNTVEQWDFFKKDSNLEANRSKIIEDIKKLTSFYLEGKFSDCFENHWSKKRNEFIKFCETRHDEIINGNLVKRSQVESVIKFALSMWMRNNKSILKEKVRAKALEYLEVDGLAEVINTEKEADDFAKQYWLRELYNMLTNEKGCYHYFLELFDIYDLQITLFIAGKIVLL